jgi:hypothetical protein
MVEVLFVRERQRGDVEQRVTLAGIGPVDDASDLVTLDEDLLDVQFAVDERRRLRPEHLVGETAIVGDDVGRKQHFRSSVETSDENQPIVVTKETAASNVASPRQRS